MVQRPWHRCLAAVWVDLFPEPDSVQPEKDLSVQQQRLDYLIRLETLPAFQMPDGLDHMGRYNVVSFKSHQETLTEFVLDELVCSFVIVRKLVSKSPDDLLPLDEFRRYIICVRKPRDLFTRLRSDLRPRRVLPGVYECRHFSGVLRLIVINQLAREEHNAPLLIFASTAAAAEYGARNYKPHNGTPGALLSDLITQRLKEKVDMNKYMEEIERDVRRRVLDSMTPEERQAAFAKATPEERLKGLPPEERLKGLPPEERLKGLPPEERLKGVPPEERLKGLPPEERLKGLSQEELAHLVRLLTQGS